jgi:hypothetical protein
VRRVGFVLLAVTSAGLAVAGCVRPGSGTPPTARPPLAAGPADQPAMPAVTLTRTGRTGLAERLLIRPDGDWLFLAAPGSARASALYDGRLVPDRRAELARLLSGPALADEALRPPGYCPAGATYRLDAGTVHAAWTECDVPDRPVLRAVADLAGSATPW